MARQPSSASGGGNRKKIVMARDVVGKRGHGRGVSSKRAAKKGGRMSWLMMSGK